MKITKIIGIREWRSFLNTELRNSDGTPNKNYNQFLELNGEPARLKPMMGVENTTILCAYIENVYVGALSYRVNALGHVWFCTIAVDPKHRGKGVASRLVECFIKDVVRFGFKEFRVTRYWELGKKYLKN